MPSRVNDNNARSASGGCNPCGYGTYAPNPGMTKCLPCPPGTVQPLDGQSFCSPCPSGLRPELPIAGKCVDPETNCAPYETREKFFGFVSCNQKLTEDCPEGFYKVVFVDSEVKRADCYRCTNQEFYDPKQNTCARCPRNQYSRGGVDTDCRPCPAGTVYDGWICS